MSKLVPENKTHKHLEKKAPAAHVQGSVSPMQVIPPDPILGLGFPPHPIWPKRDYIIFFEWYLGMVQKDWNIDIGYYFLASPPPTQKKVMF